MTPASAADVGRFLDDLLGSCGFPDYPRALNGLQLDHRGPVRAIAAAVDASHRVVDAAHAAGANFLIVHHGLFWASIEPIVGPSYRRLHALMTHDIAVYSSHLPLDAHPSYGNNALLAATLSLVPTERFAMYQGSAIGVAGTCDMDTRELTAAIQEVVKQWDSIVRVSPLQSGRRTRRWAICSGAGASSETLREAASHGIDTLIVGEGPHHTAVEAADLGIVVVYAGHYATETLGVQAIARSASRAFNVPWTFVHLPSGL